MIKHKGGFTLIELLVTVAIIAMLAASALIGYSRVQVRSRDTRRNTDLAHINTSLQNFISDGYVGDSVIEGFTNSKFQPPMVDDYTTPENTWDLSSQNGGTFQEDGDAEFMDFLKTSGYIESVPFDPINDGTGQIFAIAAGDVIVNKAGTTDAFAYGYNYFQDDSTMDLPRDPGYMTYALVSKLETEPTAGIIKLHIKVKPR